MLKSDPKVNTLQIGRHEVGPDHPVFIIAEIGINHNGDLEMAKKLIDTAVRAGCNAVKFQKRTPSLCVPPDQREVTRNTPWGLMTYLEYRERIEFGKEEYQEIDRYCKSKNIAWFASCWDEPSVDFMEEFDPVCHKVCSAALTDDSLLKKINKTGRPVILSTGMSTMEEIRHAVSLLDRDRLLIAHCTSTYACSIEELNLRTILSLKEEFGCPVGYSGHELGLIPSIAAVSLGACFVERHITLDRSFWGSDQSASLEPWDLERLVRDIREIEKALGDGVKRVFESEKIARTRLRRCR
ncbi:MAG: N-acetylneuraminate synthase family protein [Deltaproteobacteria bacterium]|nr:N-acetylneuraminate synthase family protein [Deltaproteobacteria bacterium]